MLTATASKELPLSFRLTEDQLLIQETIAELAQKEFARKLRKSIKIIDFQEKTGNCLQRLNSAACHF